MQDHGGQQLRFVQCGSRFLTGTELRYDTTEMELLAVTWVTSKCKFYLAGLQHFKLVTDHRPLIPILNHYTPEAIKNPRLQFLKEKLLAFQFSATWLAGKQLCIPDTPFRYSISHPNHEDDLLNCGTSKYIRNNVIIQAVQSLGDYPDPASDKIMARQGSILHQTVGMREEQIPTQPMRYPPYAAPVLEEEGQARQWWRPSSVWGNLRCTRCSTAHSFSPPPRQLLCGRGHQERCTAKSILGRHQRLYCQYRSIV